MLREWINPIYLDSNQLSCLRKEFQTVDPFSHIQLRDFFIPEKLQEVLQALSEEHFFFKESDLFKFSQTNDLKHSGNVILKSFISFLYSEEFIDFMQKITGLRFSKDFADIHATLYEDTDFLLCHDDKLDSRNLAFLVYLTDLTQKDGGELALYDVDAGEPSKIVKRLYPSFNTFTFFHVSSISFHSVEEVVSNAQRIAIGGWYHAD